MKSYFRLCAMRLVVLCTLSLPAIAQLEEFVGGYEGGGSLSVSLIDRKNFRLTFESTIKKKPGRVQVELTPAEASKIVDLYYKTKRKAQTLGPGQAYTFPGIKGIAGYAVGRDGGVWAIWGLEAISHGQRAACGFGNSGASGRNEIKRFEALLQKLSSRKPDPDMPRQPSIEGSAYPTHP